MRPVVNFYVRPLTQFSGKVIWLVCRIDQDTIVGTDDSEHEAVERARRIAAIDEEAGQTVRILIQSRPDGNWSTP